MSAALNLREIAAGLLAEPGARDPEVSWQALLRGEYVAIDRFEREGRSFVLARRRDESAPKLSSRERRAIELRVRGVALKVIGWELGVSQATVSRDVARAMEKLGVATQADLVRLWPSTTSAR